MSSGARQLGELETLAVHGGTTRRVEGAVVFPIFQSATYEYAATSEGIDYHSIKYVRLNNTPTHTMLHAKLALLEGGGEAVATASGMAAITTVLLAVLRAGDHLLVQDGGVYGGTFTFAVRDLPRYGVAVDFFDATDPAALAAKRRANTRAVYTEAATNPLGIVADHAAVAAFCRAHRLVSIVDATLLSPVFFRPLALGYDVVVHSATKYLNGHSDIAAGVIVSRDLHLMRQVRETLNHLGGTLDPHACFLLNRGLLTLPLRIRHQFRTALYLATRLEKHPAVKRVHFAMLPSSPYFARASSLFNGGCGGLLSFELRAEGEKEGMRQAAELLGKLSLFAPAPSLGGTESLITAPATSSHSGLSAEERQRLGITQALIRVAVGVEHQEDLWRDLSAALNSLLPAAPGAKLTPAAKL